MRLYRWAVCYLAVAVLWIPVAGGQEQTPQASPTVEGSLVHGGLERTFLVHEPPLRHRSAPAPLVIALHGGGGRGRGMEKLTGLSRLADREGFVVAYPDGIDGHWNDGRTTVDYQAQREAVDDVGFIAALIDQLVERLKVDRRRVYLTGMSNGALIAHRIALERPDRIAAIAPVEGTLLESLATSAPPPRPISVLIIKGLDAPLFEKASKRMTASDTASYWAERDGCSATPTSTVLEDRDPDDGTRVRRIAYGQCSGGTEVVLYEIDGGGHTWPGGYQYYPEERIGRTSRDIDASDVMWEFFSRHAIAD
jgi:polyhydroxybutyrate depolymerase